MWWEMDKELFEKKGKGWGVEGKSSRGVSKGLKVTWANLSLRNGNMDLVVPHDKLKKDFELINIGYKSIKSELIAISSSHDEP